MPPRMKAGGHAIVVHKRARRFTPKKPRWRSGIDSLKREDRTIGTIYSDSVGITLTLC